MAKQLICRMRLHWLFDHAVTRHDDEWACKHCGLPVEMWPNRSAKPLTAFGNWTHKVMRAFTEGWRAFRREYTAEWHQ